MLGFFFGCLFILADLVFGLLGAWFMCVCVRVIEGLLLCIVGWSLIVVVVLDAFACTRVPLLRSVRLCPNAIKVLFAGREVS